MSEAIQCTCFDSLPKWALDLSNAVTEMSGTSICLYLFSNSASTNRLSPPPMSMICASFGRLNIDSNATEVEGYAWNQLTSCSAIVANILSQCAFLPVSMLQRYTGYFPPGYFLVVISRTMHVIAEQPCLTHNKHFNKSETALQLLLVSGTQSSRLQEQNLGLH